MHAYSLPKDTDEEKMIRNNLIEVATKNAIEIPFEIMKVSYESIVIIEKMALKGNPNSITDVGVAMHCAKAAIHGAFLNVKINCNSLNDKKFVKNVLFKGRKIIKNTSILEKKVLSIVEKKLRIN